MVVSSILRFSQRKKEAAASVLDFFFPLPATSPWIRCDWSAAALAGRNLLFTRRPRDTELPIDRPAATHLGTPNCLLTDSKLRHARTYVPGQIVRAYAKVARHVLLRILLRRNSEGGWPDGIGGLPTTAARRTECGS
jgi:hypothetical protein